MSKLKKVLKNVSFQNITSHRLHIENCTLARCWVYDLLCMKLLPTSGLKQDRFLKNGKLSKS